MKTLSKNTEETARDSAVKEAVQMLIDREKTSTSPADRQVTIQTRDGRSVTIRKADPR
jgi:hypothetical protein